MALADRFDAKVLKTTTCWLWLGFVDKAGYARIREGGRETPVLYAHRYSHERFIGPIPDGFTVDHVAARGCTNRHCVNPAHLEAVTNRENGMRGKPGLAQRTQRCGRGHDLTIHRYISPKGKRNCRECRREQRAACRIAA